LSSDANPAVVHRRFPDPAPRHGVWIMRCACGWTSPIDLRPFGRGTGLDRDALEKQMERNFIAHLPADGLQTGILVDARPMVIDDGPMGADFDPDYDKLEPIIGIRGIWIMPQGVPTKLVSHYESEGVRYGVIEDGRTLEKSSAFERMTTARIEYTSG
jgi:hypothetical protein